MSTLSYVIDSVNADRLTAVLKDETVRTTPVRSAIGIFVKSQKINSDNTVKETLTTSPNDNDPETDSEWTVTLDVDGWYRFLIAEVPDFDAGDTYSIYEAVFEPSTSKVYRSKQNGNTTDTLTDVLWWEEITDPATLASNAGEANESTNIESTIYEVILLPNGEYAFANLISEVSEMYLTSIVIPSQLLETYNLLAVLVDGAVVANDRSLFNQGERIARRLESIIESLNR